MTTNAPSSDPVAELKLAHRATWAVGDYPAVARHIADDPVRDALTAARVRPGARVLDVATGSGNVALDAANAGGQVVGLDLVPEGRWGDCRAELRELFERRNVATDGSCRIHAEYLAISIRPRA
jgi:SAM-dependent methyltransferase